MSAETEDQNGGGAAEDVKSSRPPRYDWQDPKVPAGNAPPNYPRWPLAVSGLVWVSWLVFLVVMLSSRY